VQQKSEKINEEKIKCQHMADLAQADLAEAMPALEEAVKVLSLSLPLSLSVSPSHTYTRR